MNRKKRIEEILATLQPEYLEVKDESSLHQGHLNYIAGGETHFAITIAITAGSRAAGGSETLAGKNRLAQHKIINKLLDMEFKTGLHALSIKII